MAEQGRQRPLRAGQRLQAHHLRGGAGHRGCEQKFQLLLRREHLGGRHPLPLRQPQAPRGADRHAGPRELLQPELHPNRRKAGQRGVLRLLCGLRPPRAHRHRPARRAEKEPLLHRRPDGAGGAGVLRLRAEQQDLLPRDGVGGLRRGQRRAADAALRRLGHPRPGGRSHRPPLPRLQAAGAERGDLPHHAGDDGGRRPLRRRTERPDRGLPGRRQERHQPEAGQRRREGPHRQLCGCGSHRRPPVFVSRLPRRAPQLDDGGRQPLGPGLRRGPRADAGL